ncbi:type I glutamate--ammonia ligase [Candidatus Nitrosocosmicus franklandus]|uniref:Glutamine synthetase n=1 Tax=Candidatus Nitrosocosmicus franklandianus TaxID=1798806 RepID=A0A484ID04_9ARCH|nr:type I glutamate--ammonia ligase [Candidatus Nitrosocosmicus franklandus]VFJ14607.1 Glutamine synthetase [Candidatus Nitrosocosmicus franklandus]
MENTSIAGKHVTETPAKDFMQIRYTDLLGRFLAKYIQIDEEQIQEVFRKGIGLDGSSVKGFATIDESDMMLFPDRKTLRKIPLSSYEILTVIADVYNGFAQGRSNKDPRSVSQKLEDHLAVNQVTCQIGAEVECFIFDQIIFEMDNNNLDYDSSTLQEKVKNISILSDEQYGVGRYPIRRKSGYDVPTFQDSLIEFRFEVANILKKYYDIDVTNMNHEVASSGQIEINFMHNYLTQSADNVQIYKDIVRNVAKKYNKVANFMPKPIFDSQNPENSDNGSGMHVSISLWTKLSDSDRNLFYDETDPYGELSQTGRYFIGGILEHAGALSALVTPTVNSYKRIVPGFEAPVYIAWARGNRSAVVRVPINEKKSANSKRIEYRAPDPSANPYLAFSAIVAAGLDGINKKVDPGDPVSEDIYKMSDSKRKELGIKILPGSLADGLNALRTDSTFLNICFHSDLINTYLDLKEKEILELGNDQSLGSQFMLYYDV